jgi:tRNA dimethylallyltransferase
MTELISARVGNIMTPPSVIVLHGPTASGKSSAALALAERLDGVVINADSLQVYAELSILTARPDDEAQARVPHRLYGILPAAEAGSAAWWRAEALREIEAAGAAGKRAIVTGGTGLYIKALIDGLSPAPTADPEARARATSLHDELGGVAFRDALATRDPAIAARLMAGDRQRLIRAWEVVEATGIPLSAWQAMPREPGHRLRFCLIGIQPERAELYARIDRRFHEMLANGALDEARAFDRLNLPPSLPANKALGLPELRGHLAGEIDLPAAAAQAQQATRNYAKRQMTWFRHQMDPARYDGGHVSHAWFAELSERNLAEIISFILQCG